ncbi:hypothetical protein D3C84_1010780 [compost metagenome]
MQVGQFDLQLLDGIDSFTCQGAGFITAGWAVEKVSTELFEMANLGGAELDLRFQRQGGVSVGVAQAALQVVAFQRVAVLTHLHFATRT